MAIQAIDTSGHTDKFKNTIVNFFKTHYGLSHLEVDYIVICPIFWQALVNLSIEYQLNLDHKYFGAFIIYVSPTFEDSKSQIEAFNKRKGSNIGGRTFMDYVRLGWNAIKINIVSKKELEIAIRDCLSGIKQDFLKGTFDATQNLAFSRKVDAMQDSLIILHEYFKSHDSRYKSNLFIGIYEELEKIAYEDR